MVNVLTMGQIFEFLLYGCLISASIFFVLFGVANVFRLVNQTADKVVEHRWLTLVTKVVVVVLEAFAYSFVMLVLISTLTVNGWFPFGV